MRSIPLLALAGLLQLCAATAGAQDEASASMVPLPSPKTHITPQMDRLILSGIDGIYNMDFDRSQKEFDRLRAIDPDHPYSYFGSAAVAWARYVYETEQSDQALIAPFEASVKTLVAKSQAWLKKHPGDAEAFLVMGAGEGILARLLMTRRQYMKGYLTARSSIKSIRSALALDPDLHDARLGLGMYDYYSDLYPRVVRVLAKLILHGNRQRGIETLQLVAQKGHYMSVSAKLLLVEIYNEDPFGAKDPEKAIRLMEDIRKRYPGSAMLHAAQIVSLYGEKRYDDSLKACRQFLSEVSAGKYRPIEAAKGQSMAGAALWALGRKEEALEAFRKAGAVRFNGEPPRWAVWGLIRAGQTADLLGRREQALGLYRQAAAAPDHWDYRKLAAKQLSKPYAGKEDPLSIIPP